MCGLITVYDPLKPVALSNLQRISQSMRHRGPDGFSYHHEGHLFMGHSRLQVESADSDRQPILAASGALTLIVNGELYPYHPLKQQLQSQGYQFQSESDSELVLALYTIYGDDCVNYLRGEFAFVLWDATRQRLLAARDPFGIKPLHYAQWQGRWYLASEAKTLFAAGYPAQWNMQGLWQSLSHQYLRPGNSLFAGVKQIPPGYCLKIERKQCELQPYYSIDYGDLGAADLAFDVAQEKVKELFIESVKLRIPRRRKCAFSLSGGLDSSAVVSVAREFIGDSPDCYTVSFDHPDYDEYSLVDTFAREKSLHLHKVCVTSDAIIEHLDQAAYFSEGLAYNGQYVAKYLLNQTIAQGGYRVVLSGEGADEAFMGYAHLHHDYLNFDLDQERKPRQAGSSREDAIETLLKTNALQAGLMLASTSAEYAVNTPYVPSFLQAKFKFCQSFSTLFHRERLMANHQAAMQQSLLAELDSKLPKAFRSNNLWVQMVLANYILKTLGDGMEMASSVEGRLPFLDSKLFSYAASLPIHYKLSLRETKVVLRQALNGLVPEAVRIRKKHPFIAPPLASTLSEKGFNLILDIFNRDSFRENPVFKQSAVLHWVKQWRSQQQSTAAASDPVLMTLLSFAALQEQFRMDGAS